MSYSTQNWPPYTGWIVSSFRFSPKFPFATRAGGSEGSIEIRGADDSLDTALTFRINRSPGHYHVQVSYIAFFHRDGKWIAQLERFFSNELPVCVERGRETTTKLEFWWPDIPIDDLGIYGVFRPGQPFSPAGGDEEPGQKEPEK